MTVEMLARIAVEQWRGAQGAPEDLRSFVESLAHSYAFPPEYVAAAQDIAAEKVEGR